MRGLEVGGQLTEFMTKSSKVILFISLNLVKLTKGCTEIGLVIIIHR